MTNIAIVGDPADRHISTVTSHLRATGALVRHVDTTSISRNVTRLAGSGAHEILAGVPSEWPTVVWHFRPEFETPDLGIVAEEDRAALAGDISISTQWMLEAFAPSACWVNPYGAHLRGSNRILQARLAEGFGLKVPETLITSDPASLREFMADGPTVLKPISRHLSLDAGRRRMAVRVVADQLPADAELSIQPCFLQREVPKVAEWRAHVLGDEIIAIRQMPATAPRHVDWNLDRRNFRVEEQELPAQVSVPLLRLIKALDLKFACVDLLEQASGELHFLELNQMGRFLWFDEILPAARISERFAAFLLKNADARS